jgi:hypothetical protein
MLIFGNAQAEYFHGAGLEPTNTFDSAEQISMPAHLDWLAKSACELPGNRQSERMLPVGQISCPHPAARSAHCNRAREQRGA